MTEDVTEGRMQQITSLYAFKIITYKAIIHDHSSKSLLETIAELLQSKAVFFSQASQIELP